MVAAVAVWFFEQQSTTEPQTRQSQPPSRSSGGSSNNPKGDLRTLFSADDYPAEAQRKGEEGTVQVDLTVGSEGRVSTCKVIRSSGSPILDSATCRILQHRARFTLARDANGNSISDVVRTPPIVWRLEG